MLNRNKRIDPRLDNFESYDEALEAARRIREEGRAEGGVIARVVRSPYNGYTVVSIPADVYADFVSEGIPFPRIGGLYDKVPA